MGDAQRVPYDQLLREARERFEAADDFTVAVEEEFALLDRDSLDLVNQFEEVVATASGTEWRILLNEGRFAELAARHGVVKTPVRPLELY